MSTGFVQAEKAALPVAEDLERRFKELAGQLIDPNNTLSFRTLRLVQYAPIDVR